MFDGVCVTERVWIFFKECVCMCVRVGMFDGMCVRVRVFDGIYVCVYVCEGGDV